jgi:hypothetical protein
MKCSHGQPFHVEAAGSGSKMLAKPTWITGVLLKYGEM